METNYTLNEICNKYNLKLDVRDDRDLLVSVMNGKFDKNADYDDPIILTYIGFYYQKVKQSNEFDHKSMEKYFIKASNNANNNINIAMYYLGCYYYQNKQYDLMEKYFIMYLDINEPNNVFNISVNNVMIFLADYYRMIKQPIGSSYDLMEKYYLMIIDYNKRFIGYSKNSIISMFWLVDYYSKTKNYYLMKKYMEMIIDNTNYNKYIIKLNSRNIDIRIHAMRTLGYYYKKESNDVLMQKYLLMAIEKSTDLPLPSNIINTTTTNECFPLSMYNLVMCS